MEYEDVHEVDHTYGTSYPIHAFTWALLGTKDVMSATHVDAGGLQLSFLLFLARRFGSLV